MEGDNDLLLGEDVHRGAAAFAGRGRRARIDFGKRKVPMEASAHPEEDVSKLLSAAGKRYYKKLVGSQNRRVTIGRFDLCHVTASLLRFSSAPREGHLKMLEGVFGYLWSFPDIGVVVDPRDFPHLPESKLVKNLRREYGDWNEEVSVHDPQAYSDVHGGLRLGPRHRYAQVY